MRAGRGRRQIEQGVRRFHHQGLRRSVIRRRVRGDAQIGRHILAHALLGEKTRRGIDQFTQILDAVLTFLVGLVMQDQPASLDHMLDRLGQGHASGLIAKPLDQPHEAQHLAGSSPGLEHRGRGIQAAVGRTCGILQLFD